MQINANISVNEVLELVIHFNTWLENLYRYIMEITNSTEVNKTFSLLLENLISENQNIVKSSKLLEDI
jgi:hypothetical protein